MSKKFIGTHWGTYTHEKNNNKPKLNYWSKDLNPTKFGLDFINAAQDNLRISQPYIRKGWLEKNKTSRGKDIFIPVSWNKAIAYASKELLKIKKRYGNESIYAGSYGWASAGRFHHAKSQLNRFFNLFGGFSHSVQSYSYAAAQTILPHVIGKTLYELLDDHTSWNALSKKTELILMFGGMPLKNSQISSGGVGKHSAEAGMKKCIKNNVEFINISPLKTDAPSFIRAKQIFIRPNTDTALMLSLAYLLIINNTYDKKFINKYTVGFDEFKKYVLGEKKNKPCTPKWASHITGIPEKKIKNIYKNIIKKRTLISMSWSLQRASHGEQPLWIGITLASMLGHIGKSSGGFGFGYSAVNSTGDSFDKIKWPSLPQSKNKIKSFIPVARITDMLNNPGKNFLYDGKKRKYPKIKLIYWAGGNPFHHHQDLNKLVKAWQKPETIIVNEIWWNAQARHADIIFPASTALEKNDIMLNPRDPTIIANHKIIKNVGESKSDYEIFSELSKKLGFYKKFTKGLNEEQWLKLLWDQTRIEAKKNKINLPKFKTFWNKGYFELPKLQKENIMFKDFVIDPNKNKLNTPSGKIEIESKTIKKYKLKDCKQHPFWFEPYEWLGNKKNFSLHLISNQPEFKLHGQLDNGHLSKKNKIKKKEPIILNPIDAKKRKLKNNDLVEVYNKRGKMLAGVKISNKVMEGVVVVSTGSWFSPHKKGKLEIHGNPNVLTGDIPTSSLSQAPSAHTTLVEVKKMSKKYKNLKTLLYDFSHL